MALDITSYLLGKLSGGGGEADPTQLAAAYSACEDKGATLPEEKTLANLADCIETIPGQIVIPPEAGTLSSLVVGTLPKVAYVEGDPLDLSGMVILGNYSNGGQYDVTPNCTITANNPVLYTDTKIVVSLEGVTLNIPITVAGKPVKAPDNTIALYHLDSNLKDEVSGETASGTYSQCGGKFDKGCFGNNSEALYANLSKIQITLANAQSNTYTVEYWCKHDSSMSYPPAIRFNGQSTDLWSSGSVTTSGLRFNTLASSATKVYAPATFDAKNWHHYCFTINGDGTYTTFLDGKKSVTGQWRTSGTNFDIQGLRLYGGTSNYFDEFLFTSGVKYVADFEPPHGPYYIEE